MRGGALGADGRPLENTVQIVGDLHIAIDKLSKEIYSKSTHFIFELIQNAEDNFYKDGVLPSLKFRLLETDPTNTKNAEGCLCIYNNEAGFKEENVRALSNLGKSTKTLKNADGFIGEKGIGFKSVFKVTTSPHIFSNGYRFKFLEHDPVSTLGFIVPYWLDTVPDIVSSDTDHTTVILLPLKKGEYKKIKSELAAFEPETILFLNKISQLEIELPGKNIIVEKNNDGSVTSLTVLTNSIVRERKYWMEAKTFALPAHVVEEKRPDFTHRDVTIAFPLDHVSGKEKVFAYLPTEENLGLPFYINADFLLSSNRESVVTDNDWNKWLVKCAGQLAGEGIMSMLNDELVSTDAYRFIPIHVKFAKGKTFFEDIGHVIYKKLENSECIRCDDGVLRTIKKCRSADPKLRELLGVKKPSFFEDIFLVEAESQRYLKRLVALGLLSVESKDLDKIFSDDNWNSGKDIGWTAKALKYLASKIESEERLQRFRLMPTMDGSKSRAAQTFLPLAEEHKKLLTYIPSELKTDLKILDPMLVEVLKKKDILISSFGLREFSLPSFVEKILLPRLNDKEQSLPLNHLKDSIRFCLQSWGELEKTEEIDLLLKLPMLLENNRIVSVQDYGQRELVTPRKWDEETGWQLVFDALEDKLRFAILNEFYTLLPSAEVKKYLKFIDAHEFPRPSESTYHATNIDRSDPAYYKLVNAEYFMDWGVYNFTKYKHLITFVPPTRLKDPGKLSGKFRKAFVHWLNNFDDAWRYSEPSLKASRAKWFYRTARTEDYKSEIFQALINLPWVKTSQGLKPPGQVFINDPNLRQWFKGKLAFLEDDLEEHVIDMLGIKRTANAEDLISYLASRSNGNSTEKPDAIYRHLNEKCEGYEDAFAAQPLIFTSQEGGKWLTSKQVFWADGSAALSDEYGWLENDYPNTLKDFFVEKLGVKESIDIVSYTDCWLKLQDTNDQLTVETFLNRGFAKLRFGHEKLEGTNFQDECMLWSLDKNWQSPEVIYLNDSAPLFNLFKDDLFFVWTPKGLTHSRLERFFTWLEVKSISSSVIYDIGDDQNSKKSEVNHYLNEHSTELIARLVSSADQDDLGDFEALVETGKLHAIYALVEFEVEQLVVNASVLDRSHEISDSAAFIDWKTNRAFIAATSHPEDVKDDLAVALARHIRGAHYKNIVAHLKDILSVRTKERRRKLQDDYGWGFTEDHRKQFSKLKKGFDQSPRSEIPETLPDAPEILDPNNVENPETESKPVNASPAQETDQEPSTIPTDPIAHQPEPSPGGTTDLGKSTNVSEVPPKSSADSSKSSDEASLGADTPVYANVAQPGPQYPSASYNNNTSRVGKSRSEGRARTHNYAKRNRIVSYVSHDDPQERDSEEDAELAAVRKALGDRGEKIVAEDLRAKGYLAEIMPSGNHGFDIEAIHPKTGELLYIEVKSQARQWDAQGVTISQKQYDYARHYGESYFLAIVENLNRPPHSPPVYIQDPANKIDNYAFDVNWRKISTKVSTIIPPAGEISGVEALIAETDSVIGKVVIEFCEQQGLDLPEIGGDICDTDGRVILDNIEMVWEEYAFGVYLADTMANIDFGKAANWAFLPDDEIRDIKLKLQEFLDIDIEDRTP